MQYSAGGNIDWMSLAAKMFMSKLNNNDQGPVSAPHRPGQRVTRLVSPPPSPPRARSPFTKHRPVHAPTPPPSYLPPDCVAAIKQFETLRIQLLRHLVLYQSQLLALKMPPLPHLQAAESSHKTMMKKRKMYNPSEKIKKQTSSKKIVKNERGHEVKKWEKIQFPAHTMKDPNTRRSNILKKTKKSSKKASKRKLENIQTLVSKNYLENNGDVESKRPCQPYKSYMGQYSSSSDSLYSQKHIKYDNNFCLDPEAAKDVVQENSSLINTSANERKKNEVQKLPRRRTKISKTVVSAYDTATDEGRSTQ